MLIKILYAVNTESPSRSHDSTQPTVQLSFLLRNGEDWFSQTIHSSLIITVESTQGLKLFQDTFLFLLLDCFVWSNPKNIEKKYHTWTIPFRQTSTSNIYVQTDWNVKLLAYDCICEETEERNFLFRKWLSLLRLSLVLQHFIFATFQNQWSSFHYDSLSNWTLLYV